MGHDHDHSHAPANQGRAFVIGISLNLGIVVLEVVYGLLSHSMALVADAGHNLSDVLGLALAWGAARLAKRRPSKRRTYGLRKSSILAALANAMLLLVATGAVAWESIERIRNPGVVHGKMVIAVAAVAVVINGASALLFMRDRERDLNMRSAFLHLAGDAAIALGVVVSATIILFTGWYVLDPIVGILVSIVIFASTWSLLRESLDLGLDAVPEGIDPDKVRAHLRGLPGVTEVHDLHIWAMSTTETALTVHLVIPGGAGVSGFFGELSKTLHDNFRIEHVTIQIEAGYAQEGCAQGAEGSICAPEGEVTR
jgi:cobalt-zinc-cadmium efflux system protein